MPIIARGARTDRRSRVWRTWSALALALLVGSNVAQSQSPPVSAGALLLQLRPRAGDTLRLRIDQTIEMGGGSRASADSDATQVTTLAIQARLAVETSDARGANVVAMTDSVRIESSDEYQSPVLRAARQMQGQRVRFHVAPDGATSLAQGDAWAGAAVGSLLSQLPATLPREPVAPGGSWTRSLDIPLAVGGMGKGNATLTASFRFDSLSRSGDFAFLTMKGRLVRAGPTPDGGTTGKERKRQGYAQTSGTVGGSILIDRRRGWIADARTVISLRSLVTSSAPDALPIRVQMKITQWMRVM